MSKKGNARGVEQRSKVTHWSYQSTYLDFHRRDRHNWRYHNCDPSLYCRNHKAGSASHIRFRLDIQNDDFADSSHNSPHQNRQSSQTCSCTAAQACTGYHSYTSGCNSLSSCVCEHMFYAIHRNHRGSRWSSHRLCMLRCSGRQSSGRTNSVLFGKLHRFRHSPMDNPYCNRTFDFD